MKKLFPLFVLLYTVGYLSPLYADLGTSVVKTGSYFWINTHTYNDQIGPAVAAIDRGGFVVVWTSYWQDETPKSVYGQMFDSSGAKVGTEFKVNTYATDSQYEPCVAGLTEGGFVVVWTSWGQDGSVQGIYGQRFNSVGNKVGNEFQANTYTDSTQAYPCVAGLTEGGFVVVWSSWGQDGSDSGIYGQRFNSLGAKVGDEFQVNTYTDNHQRDPSVVNLSQGGYVVVWESDGQDGSDLGIYGQRFNSSGAKAGDEFQVNTHTASSQEKTSVAALSDGKFIVIWQSWYQDGDRTGVYGQVLDSASAKIGTEFQVNTHTKSYQGKPSVSALFGNAYVALWKSEDYPENSGCYGQLLDISGNKLNSEFEAYHLPAYTKISVAFLSSTVFVVVADSPFDNGKIDVNNIGIVGQIFQIPSVKDQGTFYYIPGKERGGAVVYLE